MQGGSDAKECTTPGVAANRILASPVPTSVEYQISVDDILAFNEFHLKNSKAIRPSRLGKILTWSIIVFGVLFWSTLAIAQLDSINTSHMVWAGIFVVIWILVFRMLRRSTKARIRRMYSEGENRNLISRRSIKLMSTEIVETTQYSESKTKWEAVEKVVASPSHLFIYTSAAAALIVPRSAFRSTEEFEYFQSTARLFHSAVVPGRCKKCGYDLLGNSSGRCPECGTELASSSHV